MDTKQEDLHDLLILYKYRLTRRFIRRDYLRPLHLDCTPEEQQFNLYWGHEPLSEEEQQLLKCYAASKNLRHAFGPKAGEPLDLDMSDDTSKNHYNAELCTTYQGFNLHANTVVQADHRDRLEQLCRYIRHLLRWTRLTGEDSRPSTTSKKTLVALSQGICSSLQALSGRKTNDRKKRRLLR